jgi:LacI family repressor for deo operon, udp, cdd, tsx, nupC, and nupG
MRAVRDGRQGDPSEADGLRPNIADVAALAGVSIATVSRSLSNPERVSKVTRERVLEVVRQTGYTPNVAARSLRVARSMTVLVVVPSLITVFFSALLLGVDRELSAEGYGLLVGNLDDRPDKEARLVDLVLAGQADGVVLLNGHSPQGRLRSLADSRVPVVAISVPTSGEIPAVLVREREAAAAVAAHLLSLGHRRFGYVTGPKGNYVDGERWAGFRDALVAAGIREADIRRYPGNFRIATGVEAGRRFLADADRPTAVFAVSDEMAVGFMRAVRDGGLDVPRDVSVAGYDGIEFADYCEPRLTTVRQPREQMGNAAAGILVRMMQGEAIPPECRRLYLDGELRIGGTTAPPGKRLALRPRRKLPTAHDPGGIS